MNPSWPSKTIPCSRFPISRLYFRACDPSCNQATQITRKMSEKVKEVVIEEVDRVKELSREAARSGAYLYPIKVFSPQHIFFQSLPSSC